MIYRFGDFSLEPAARRLSKSGREIRLEPKVYALLELLVRHRGSVLDRTTIHESIWPDVSVGPAALGRLVKELRRALGDDGTAQRAIRTIRGVGLQLLLTVDVVPDTDSGKSAVERILHARARLLAVAEGCVHELKEEIEVFVARCEVEMNHAIENE